MAGRLHFPKTWGSEPTEKGVRFRLWAPSQESIALQISETGVEMPMQAVGDGWFEVETDRVRDGYGYQFVLADGFSVPDPAARAQVDDVHGPSLYVDPRSYAWRNADWRGRPWEETVFYELHTGTFTEEGTFDAVEKHLDHLAETGITAVELLPVSHFSGSRGWGYDGVLLYAPHRVYGGPNGLKSLVDAAHDRGLMMFLDVVYNHFGPDGNYLHLYAPDFFHPEHVTPWGSAIAYELDPVRRFFIENALYWLDEYRFDGLRLDAIDQIDDRSDPTILEELAAEVRRSFPGRHVHLTTEDDRNVTGLHERDAEGRPRLYSGEWNDDFHHAAHVIATGEDIGYYSEYSEEPVVQLAQALASGYVYQGEPSPYRDGRPRGESSAHLPPSAFVNFIQNHDQIGNRAFNERLTELSEPKTMEALLAILLLAPQIPLLFMGEEWGETRSFGFFTDFHGELGRIVREGRRREFAKWPQFASDEHSEKIADPNVERTFRQSRLDWTKLDRDSHRNRLAYVADLLAVRRREIVPLIPMIGANAGRQEMLAERAFVCTWNTADSRSLSLAANFGDEPVAMPASRDRVVFASPGMASPAFLPPASVISMVAGEAGGGPT